MEYLKRLLLYGGTDRETFREIFPEVTEANRKNLLVFSLITLVGMATMVFASYYDMSLVKNRIHYLICAGVSLVICLILLSCRKDNRRLIYICVYLFEAVLFGFGIILGTIVEPNETSVSFPIILFAVPLLFTEVPLRMSVASFVGIVAYYFAAKATQDPVMLGYNLSNVIPYGLISIVVSIYMMRIKIQRYALERENRVLSESDQLTGMLNRRCYEQHLQQLREKGCEAGMLFCEFDVNGLKAVNDNLGHPAGDEMICGAARCIEGVFGPYGKCYRIGGDEFVAVLEGAAPKAEELEEALRVRCSCFKGTLVSGLAISTGIVASGPEDSVDAVMKLADEEMYRNKKAYYERTGIDRRK